MIGSVAFTDISNIRSLYAEVVASGLVDPEKGHSGSITEIQQVEGWTTDSTNTKIAGVTLGNITRMK